MILTPGPTNATSGTANNVTPPAATSLSRMHFSLPRLDTIQLGLEPRQLQNLGSLIQWEHNSGVKSHKLVSCIYLPTEAAWFPMWECKCFISSSCDLRASSRCPAGSSCGAPNMYIETCLLGYNLRSRVCTPKQSRRSCDLRKYARVPRDESKLKDYIPLFTKGLRLHATWVQNCKTRGIDIGWKKKS